MIRLNAVPTTPLPTVRPERRTAVVRGSAVPCGIGGRAGAAMVRAAICLALTGCAGGMAADTPVAAAARADAATGAGAGPAGLAAAPAADFAFTMADGTVLPARQWLPPPGTPVRRIVLALHGFNDSRDAWVLPGPLLAAAGFVVVAPDQRGFGASPSRGRWAGTDRLVEDAWSMVGTLHARFPGLPLTVMGESMGGAVAMLVAARHGARDGGSAASEAGAGGESYVLLAPAVWDRAEIGVVLATSLWLAAGVAPGYMVTGGEVPIQVVASDNRAALLALFHDPLTLGATRLDVLAGLVDVMDHAAAAAPLLRGRVLVLDGGHDRLVPPAATAATWAKLPASVRRAFYPGGYHLLLRDLDRGLPTADVISWLDDPDASLPSGADAAAAAWLAGHSWEDEPAGWLPSGVDALGGREPAP